MNPMLIKGIKNTSAELVDHYLDHLSLGWRRRELLLDSPTRVFSDLLVWDRRLGACVEALALLADETKAACQEKLGLPLKYGDAFALAYYAFFAEDADLAEACCGIAQALPNLQAPLLAALEFAPLSAQLLEAAAKVPPHLRLRLLAARCHELETDAAQADATARWIATIKATPENVCASLEYMRCRGDKNGIGMAEHYLRHPLAIVKHQAAQTLLALQAPDSLAMAGDTLALLLDGGDAALCGRALQSILVYQTPNAASVLEKLRSAPDRHFYLQALGWRGRIDAVPILIDHLADPRYARTAAAQLTLLTGADPVRDRWQAAAAPPPRAADTVGDSLANLDADAEVPWPAQSGFYQWWNRHRQDFTSTGRYLGGRETSTDGGDGGGVFLGVLRGGPMAWRGLAAMHLQQQTLGAWFPIHLPAKAQQHLFHTFFKGKHHEQAKTR